MAICSTSYTCVPNWYDATNNSDTGGVDVILHADGPHANDINVSCIVNAGNIQFQIKDNNDVWFTPSEAAYTVTASNLVRIPRANMPDIRIIATADAVFAVHGSL